MSVPELAASEGEYKQSELNLIYKPLIVYDSKVGSKALPFELEINAGCFSGLLKASGIPDEEIQKVKVFVHRGKGPMADGLAREFGNWDAEKREVKFYTEEIEKRHTKILTGVHTTSSLERDLRESLLHEASHIVDSIVERDSEKKLVKKMERIDYAVLAGTAVASALVARFMLGRGVLLSVEDGLVVTIFYRTILFVSALEYRFRPNEIKARKFAAGLIDDPAYQDLVKVNIRSE